MKLKKIKNILIFLVLIINSCNQDAFFLRKASSDLIKDYPKVTIDGSKYYYLSDFSINFNLKFSLLDKKPKLKLDQQEKSINDDYLSKEKYKSDIGKIGILVNLDSIDKLRISTLKKLNEHLLSKNKNNYLDLKLKFIFDIAFDQSLFDSNFVIFEYDALSILKDKLKKENINFPLSFSLAYQQDLSYNIYNSSFPKIYFKYSIKDKFIMFTDPEKSDELYFFKIEGDIKRLGNALQDMIEKLRLKGI